METKLKEFLTKYIGQGKLKKDKVTQDAVDGLMLFAVRRHIEQDIIDYGSSGCPILGLSGTHPL